MVNMSSVGPSPESLGESSTSMHPEPEVDRQLARLFGESIFGALRNPAQYMAAGTTPRKRGWPAKRLLVIVGVCAVVAASMYLAKAGFRRQEDRTREQVAHDLATYLVEGELFRAGRHLDLLAPRTAPLDEADPHLDLILQAEAALYRYHDGDKERWRRTAPFLRKETGNARRELARFVISAQAERVPRKAALEAAIARLSRDPVGFAALASVHEAEGSIPAARAAWERADDLGPLWLPLRFTHAFFEFRSGRPKQAIRVTESMIAAAPDSPWSLSARALFAPSLPLPPRDQKEAPRTPLPLPKVGVYYQHLVAAYVKAKAGDSSSARTEVVKALEAVDGAPFVLDAFDTLVEAKARDVAFELTSLEVWPRQNPMARERMAALEIARAPRALPTAEDAGAMRGARDIPAASSAKQIKSTKRADKKATKRRAGRGAGKKVGRRG